jgi:hypothetical protein
LCILRSRIAESGVRDYKGEKRVRAADPKAAGDIVPTATWLIRRCVNGGRSDGVTGAFPAMFPQKARKTRIRREKCASEILVNGFNVARVHHKTQPEITDARRATASILAPWPHFPMQNQCDRRCLTRPQGAIGYDGHNEAKGAENPEVA